MTLYPFRGTYKLTPRSRSPREVVFFASGRKEAFEYLLRVTDRESFGKGVPGFVNPLTCEEADRAGVPMKSEGWPTAPVIHDPWREKIIA